MLKNSFPFLLTLLLLSCSGTGNHSDFKLKKASFYPRWLSSGTLNADQTSGIAFIKKLQNDDKYFLLADDTGSILWLKISDDTVFTISPVKFSRDFQSYIVY
jgi:hypothetical protein